MADTLRLPRAVQRQGHCRHKDCLPCAVGDYATCLTERLRPWPMPTKRNPFEPRQIAFKAERLKYQAQRRAQRGPNA